MNISTRYRAYVGRRGRRARQRLAAQPRAANALSLDFPVIFVMVCVAPEIVVP